MPTQAEIQKLAYELWEKEGRPHGRHMAHYYQAERVLQERAAGNGSPAAPAKPKRIPLARKGRR